MINDQDVIHLVIAAREFLEEKNDMGELSDALDKALSKFVDLVPYENDPDLCRQMLNDFISDEVAYLHTPYPVDENTTTK